MSDRDTVTHAECNSNIKLLLTKMENLHSDIDVVMIILRGSQGRNGLVKDVNDLMNQSRTMNALTSAGVGILAALVTNYLQRAFGG